MRRTADVPPRALGALDRLALLPLALIGWPAAHLPLGVGLWVGRRLGDLACWALPGRRAVVRQNLALAFGRERSAEEITLLCRLSFQHLGMTAVETCAFFFVPLDRLRSLVRVEGMDHLRSAMARGRGALLLTAHFGNWELLATSHILTGYPLSVVVRPLDHPLLNRLVARLRARSGAEMIEKRRALPSVLAALGRGRMVGILLDQNSSRREGVFVPFFGVLASTSKSLALLALKTGAPVVPVFIHREPDGHHRVVVSPELPMASTGDRERDFITATAAFTRAIEEAVRRRPEQWFWAHRRWKTRPPE